MWNALLSLAPRWWSLLLPNEASVLGDLIGNPRTWGADTFLVLVVGSLALRLLIVPASRSLLVLRGTLLLLSAVFLYFLVRGSAESRWHEALAHANQIISLERSLGIFWEPELQSRILSNRALIDGMNWVYIWGHWPFIAAVCLWLCLRHGHAYPIYRNALLMSGGLGLVIFSLYPVAPPRLLHDLGFVDTVALHSRSYRVLQPPALVNPYAAMPSLHFGWDLLFSVALIRHAHLWLVRSVGFIMPVAMFCSIVLTASHYILDGIIGGVLSSTALVSASALTHRVQLPYLGHGQRTPSVPGLIGSEPTKHPLPGEVSLSNRQSAQRNWPHSEAG